MDFQRNTTDERPKETGTRAPHPSPLDGNPPREPKIHSKASMATGKKKKKKRLVRQSTNSNKSLHLRMGRMDGRNKKTSVRFEALVSHL